MFVKSTLEVGVTQRVVATLVACAVVMGSVGYFNYAQAANLIEVSNTLTDSAPTAVSEHAFQFEVPTGSAIIGTDDIVITFDSQDDGAVGQAFAGGDISTAVSDATNMTFQVAGGGFAAPTFVASDANSITIEGIAATAGQVVEIVVAAAAGITNPTKVNPEGVGDSYEFEISVANGTTDIGRTRAVVIDTVEVTAIVPTRFEFEVRPVLNGTTVNGEATDIDSSSTTIPFGELVVGTPVFIAQQLSVTTNSLNGFVVTVEKDGELVSSNGADINTYTDGADVVVPGAWTPPSNTLNDDLTYGHWGMTTEDGSVNSAGAPNFTGADQFIAVLDTPQVIFGHNGPTDGAETGAGTAADDDEGLTEVGYKIEIGSLQEAGDDYTATLTYIATPTF